MSDDDEERKDDSHPSFPAKVDYLYVWINGSPYKIYELDTMESLKIRLAANKRPGEDVIRDGTEEENEQEEIEDEEDKSKVMMLPDNSGPIPPLLPSLIILEEHVEVVRDPKIVAGCTAVHIRRQENDEVNPLNGRSFRMINFYDEVAKGMNEARGLGSNEAIRARHFKLAQDMMKLFSIPDLPTYVNYTIFFYFGDIEGMSRVFPAVRRAFVDTVEKEMGEENFESVKNKYEVEKPNLKNAKEANLETRLEDLKLFRTFRRKLGHFLPADTSNLQLDRTRISIKFQIATDIYELFNGMILSNKIPFINVWNFYKVVKTFKPPIEWVEKKFILRTEDGAVRDDVLIMHVFNRFIESEKNKIRPDPKYYSPVYIIAGEVDEETHVTNIQMEIESRVDDQLREENLLQRIFDAFPSHLKITDCTWEQTMVDANYLYPLSAPASLDIPLFYDLVMNDELISQLMVINESSRTSRERGGIFSYVRWNNHMTAPKNTPLMSCRINIIPVENAQKTRFTDVGLMPPKEDMCLSVSIYNVPTLSEAKRVRVLLNRILDYYYS